MHCCSMTCTDTHTFLLISRFSPQQSASLLCWSSASSVYSQAPTKCASIEAFVWQRSGKFAAAGRLSHFSIAYLTRVLRAGVLVTTACSSTSNTNFLATPPQCLVQGERGSPSIPCTSFNRNYCDSVALSNYPTVRAVHLSDHSMNVEVLCYLTPP